MKEGYLCKDRLEKVRIYTKTLGGKNRTRSWSVSAWRVVDAAGNDLFQPWATTKAEAKATAKSMGIHIVARLDVYGWPVKGPI